MSFSPHSFDATPVIADPAQFDRRSGNWLERLVFNHSRAFMLVCLLLTLVLGVASSRLSINAAFDNMIPQNQAYIKNYFDGRDKLGGLGNVMRIVIENPKGDIYDPAFLELTQQINDAVFLTPGVDRSYMKSIWMPSVRWSQVTEQGYQGGSVVPEGYNGSPNMIATLRDQIWTAGIVGSLVSNKQNAIMLQAPLLEIDPQTGKRLDYAHFARDLENIRQRFQAPDAEGQQAVNIHIVGFAKLVGDLIDGLWQIIGYFAFAVFVSAVVIYAYTRCMKSTALVLVCSLVAVIWQLGLIQLMGFELDPYSVLVPFLVFAIGVSHGAQKMNGIMQDIAQGTHKYVAARYTFRRLFKAGVTALLADAVGFGVLMAIDIPVIKSLALVASVGVAVLIVTNLLLLPVLLSVVGVSQQAALRSISLEEGEQPTGVWALLERFTERKWAWSAVVATVLLGGVGYWLSLQLQTGDLDPGAPELRADSRYNLDVAYINANFGLSSDQFIIFVRTAADACSVYGNIKKIELLTNRLRELPVVQSVTSLSDVVANVSAGLTEGNPKWHTVPRNDMLIGGAVQWTLNEYPEMVDKTCAITPVTAYLTDHKAETLQTLIATVEQFAAEQNSDQIQFQLAAGSAGIEAVTNIVVQQASRSMLLYVYAAVMLLCLITFGSWRAVIVAVVPLILTSILCEAMMVLLGMGVKVATLPVIALGVGIGVDYALYLLSVQLQYLNQGMSLRQAYRKAAAFTGKIVAMVGITLAGGVITWAFSPIKFQADMGILLTFMFLLNMVGALVLIPALSYFFLNPQKKRVKRALAKRSGKTDPTLVLPNKNNTEVKHA